VSGASRQLRELGGEDGLWDSLVDTEFVAGKDLKGTATISAPISFISSISSTFHPSTSASSASSASVSASPFAKGKRRYRQLLEARVREAEHQAAMQKAASTQERYMLHQMHMRRMQPMQRMPSPPRLLLPPLRLPFPGR
jgi:hypothetical protein